MEKGAKVSPIQNYRQQNGEVGDKLIIGKEYIIRDWFSFGGRTMVILESGEYVYKQQLLFIK